MKDDVEEDNEEEFEEDSESSDDEWEISKSIFNTDWNELRP